MNAVAGDVHVSGSGVAATFTYNARLQLATLAYAKSGTNLFSLTYNYATGNNGQIQSITDNVNSGRTATYSYDAWSRLKTAATTGSAQYPAWGLSWAYDRYGNRKQQSVTAGSGVPSNAVTPSPTTNRLIDAGYAYDLAGNMTADGLNTLVYDAENRVTTNTQAGASSTYVYDGNSLRVKKTVSGATTVYIFSGAKVIAEYASGAAPGSPTKEYIYAGPQLLATITGATTNYHIADHLSPRVTTDTNGTAIGTQGHYPYGEDWYSSSSTTKFKFTSYERDSESGNDYAMARTYVNRLGRFSSTDPLSGSLAAPQSLNRYSYVANDPIGLIDPLGLTPSIFGPIGGSSGGGGWGSGADPFTTCSMDGIDIPCSWVAPFLSMGSAWLTTFNGLHLTTNADYPGCYLNNDNYVCPIWELAQDPDDLQPPDLHPTPPTVNPNLVAPSPPPPKPCDVKARVLQGNPATIGKQGGFPGVKVAAGSAAVIPSQFGLTKTELQPFIGSISAYSSGQLLFNGITEVIGGKSPIPGTNVRDALQKLNPGRMIFELPSAKSDLGVQNVTLFLPPQIPCP